MGEMAIDPGRYRASFLFADPSVVEGLAHLVDFGGVFNQFNDSPSPQLADLRSSAQDWCAVGDHLRRAVQAWRTSAVPRDE